MLAHTPLVDVRAPVEFLHGSLPGAVSLPLLFDEERAAVGTTYKEQGQDAAIALGLQLVSGDAKEVRLNAWAEFFRAHPEAYLFCFRGGLRSQSVKRALAETRALRIPLIEGGYKRTRSLLMLATLEIGKQDQFAVVTGFTGARKTVLLRQLDSCRRVCDLEGLANHKGSAFGNSGVQPTQINFENEVALRLLDLNLRSDRSPILLEDESRNIGQRGLPLELHALMGQVPLYFVESSPAERAVYLTESYVLDSLGMVEGDRDEGRIEALRLSTQKNLSAIERRLGLVERRELSDLVDEACRLQKQTGELAVHHAWVERLLVRYYDKLYAHSMALNAGRVVFRGSFDEVAERLANDKKS